jgi:hypothetical protein
LAAAKLGWRALSVMKTCWPFAALTALLFLTSAQGDDPKLPNILSENFDKGADRWQPTDPAVWKVVNDAKGNYYSQFDQSRFMPPHRSPFNFARLKDVVVSDFVLEAMAQSTTKPGPHIDMCIIFGYQDPAHFYYAHTARSTDDIHNQIHIVNGADRKKITAKSSGGAAWDEKWHKVKVVRTVDDGKIEVYFDEMKAAIMTATDKTFMWGQVGIGSFDDTGNWKDIVLHGKLVEKR